MSHYAVVVLTEESNEDEVFDLLAPYDEQIEVAPYEEACYCINANAFRARNEASAEHGIDWEKFREEYWADQTIEHGEEEWQKRTKWALDWEKQYELEHPEIYHASPDCPDCNGTGLRVTTYNPDSKWDWYEFGGRWAGELFGELDREETRGNSRPTCELLDHDGQGNPFYPFAIVTPDGQWHEKGKMGWWAMVTDEKPDDTWHEEVRELYEKFGDSVAVLVDCHI
jgi:hypothetical protein